jgi:hypothetical protein
MSPEPLCLADALRPPNFTGPFTGACWTHKVAQELLYITYKMLYRALLETTLVPKVKQSP